LPSEYASAAHCKHADEPAALYVIEGQGVVEARLVSPVALHAEPAGHGSCTDGDGQYDPSAHKIATEEPAGQYEPLAHTAIDDGLAQYDAAGQAADAVEPAGQNEPFAHTAIDDGVAQYDAAGQATDAVELAGQYVPFAHATCVGDDEPEGQ
jgi:hypothetical protein